MKPDPAHVATDDLLEEIEKKVAREYARAAKEAQEKLEDYLNRFAVKDKIWREAVERGEKTVQDYQRWRTGQIMIGKRWEEMKDTLAEDFHRANVIARSTVDGYMPEVYALNHNYATFEVEKGSLTNTSYTLYDRETVERLMRDDPEVLPPPGKNLEARIAAGQDVRWQKGQIQSVTMQSIVQGESIPNMSKRIAREMGQTNNASTVRYARTATTEAENAGRQAAYERAQDMGIKVKKTWLATLDNRTRHEHRILDGQTVPVDEPFKVYGEEIMYPGDPSADPSLVWNCRCTTITQIQGFERDVTDLGLRHDENLAEMSYDDWRKSRS